MLFEILLLGSGYLLGRKAAAITTTVPATVSFKEIILKGQYVNNDGWTYGVQHRWDANGHHWFKQWLVNPEPYEDELYLTFNGSQEFDLGLDDPCEVYKDIKNAVDDETKEIVAKKYHGYELDAIELAIK